MKEDEDLRQSRFIEEEDSRFAYSHAQYGKREFADSSLFTRAIVKIRRIEE